MRAKAVCVERAICAAQAGRVRERVEQSVVTRARLVRAGQNRIDDAQRGVCADALIRDTVARYNRAKARCRHRSHRVNDFALDP